MFGQEKGDGEPSIVRKLKDLLGIILKYLLCYTICYDTKFDSSENLMSRLNWSVSCLLMNSLESVAAPANMGCVNNDWSAKSQLA